jgi:diguanylate cyclase (GGDEF)-like protein
MGELFSESFELTIEEIDALNHQAYMLRNTNSEEATKLANIAAERSRDIEYIRGEGQALRTVAAVLARSNPAKGFVVASNALELLQQVEDESGMAACYMTHFCYFHHVGWYEQSFSVLQKAREYAIRAKNVYVEAIAVYNMGVNSEERQQFATAIEYFEQASELAKAGQNDQIQWSAHNAMWKLKAMNGASEEMVDQFRLGLKQIIQTGHVGFVVDAYVNLAILHKELGQYREALVEVRKGIREAKRGGQLASYCVAMSERASILLAAGKLMQAKRAFEHAYQVSKKAHYKMNECNMLERLAFCHQQLGLYEQSTDYLYQHINLKAELLNELSESRMRSLQTFHNVESLQREAAIVRQKNEELAAINEELHTSLEQQARLQKELMRLASTDELTGAMNRRQVINDGILEMERYRHTGACFSVTLIDIDYFKAINDNFGHAVGDEVLKRLTRCCTSLLRKFDVFGRLGGEEFCIIHHDTDSTGASKAVERLMKSISELDVSDILGDRGLTVSMGIAEVRHNHETFYEVLHDADMALYESKRSGRATYRICQSRVIEAA